MRNAERAARLEAMCDRLSEKAAAQAEVIARVNAKVDHWLALGARIKDQNDRALTNAHALELAEALGDARTRPTPEPAEEIA
jgi:hypothetical protein